MPSTVDEHRSKSIETVFLIAICPQIGDKWQSKTLFLSIFDLSLDSYGVFDCSLPIMSTKQRIKCLVQGHNTVTLPVGSLELATLGSLV